MNEYIGTFGIGQTLAKRFVRIQAETISDARRQMFDAHGSLWAFLYNSEQDAGVAEYGLIEVMLGTSNARMP